MKSIKLKLNGVVFEVNPYLELLGVAFCLYDFSINKIRTNKKEITQAKETFSKFKNHNFITHLKQLTSTEFFNYSGPVELFLSFSHNIKNYDYFLSTYNITHKEIAILKNEMKDFIKKSNFIQYFRKNKVNYIYNINQYIKTLSNFSPIEFLEKTCKIKIKNLHINLMHLVSTANYGPTIKKQSYICVRSYLKSYDNKICFAYDMPYSTSLLLHESGHTIINPITKKYINQINQIGDDKFKKILDLHPYGSHKETVVNEIIIRTLECLYIKKHFINDFESFMQDYINEGFIQIPELLNLIETNYLNNLNSYTSIEDYYNNILNHLRK